MHRVLDVALGPGEPQVPQGPHERGVVGVRQVAHPHLQVDDVLGEQAGDARRADVVDPDRPLARGRARGAAPAAAPAPATPVVRGPGSAPPGGVARRPCRRLSLNGTSRSLPQRVDLRRASCAGVPSLSSHTSAAARRCSSSGLGRDPRPGVGLGQPARADAGGTPGSPRRRAPRRRGGRPGPRCFSTSSGTSCTTTASAGACATSSAVRAAHQRVGDRLEVGPGLRGRRTPAPPAPPGPAPRRQRGPAGPKRRPTSARPRRARRHDLTGDAGRRRRPPRRARPVGPRPWTCPSRSRR